MLSNKTKIRVLEAKLECAIDVICFTWDYVCPEMQQIIKENYPETIKKAINKGIEKKCRN